MNVKNLSTQQETELKDGRLLPLMEEFYSLQGEGRHTGQAAYFLRIGGCDVGCHFCDVKESWNAQLHPLTNVDDLVERATRQPAQSAIVTGGEPLLYNLDYLCQKLHENKITTYLETSGSSVFSGEWDWVCLSAKRQQPPLPQNYQKAHELKMIICSPDDFDFAEQQAEQVSRECLLYLQPEWSVSQKLIPQLINYILNHPKWRISLQTHKFMRIP